MYNQIKKDLSGYRKYRYFKKIRKDGFGTYRTVSYTRARAIKCYCLECVGFSHEEMKNCSMPECPLFPYRFGKLPNGNSSQDRLKAIRSHCLECCGDDQDYILKCPSELCPIHPFRLGGYKTDLSSLILAERIENFSVDRAGSHEIEQKIEVWNFRIPNPQLSDQGQ